MGASVSAELPRAAPLCGRAAGLESWNAQRMQPGPACRPRGGGRVAQELSGAEPLLVVRRMCARSRPRRRKCWKREVEPGGRGRRPRSHAGALAAPPADAIACVAEDGATTEVWSRHYELGDSPKAGYTAFYDHLKSLGWEMKPDKSGERFEAVFIRSGHSLELFASSNVKDKGWLTVTFTPAKKK